MDCKACDQTRREFTCASCVSRDLQEHRKFLGQITKERDSLVSKAAVALVPLQTARARRADAASLRRRVEEIQRHTKILRDTNEQTRERLQNDRNALALRRQTLDDAYKLSSFYSSPPRTPTPTPPGGPPRSRSISTRRKSRADEVEGLIEQSKERLKALQEALARARQGLVQELVDVFDIVEVGGRPAQGVRAATRGEWAIGGLVLPVPGDIRRYTPQQINAAITFVLHFLSLLTFYLGIKLPFQVSWSGGKLGVGIPEVYATKGTDSGGWAKWSVRNPLHLPLSSASTSNSPPTSAPPSPTSSPRPGNLLSPLTSPSLYLPPSAPVLGASDSHTELELRGDQTPASFTTALAMLLFDIAYLAHTQEISVPLSYAGEALRNLYAICCSAELGRNSHASHSLPTLSPPTPPNFPLDFKQLLQATSADPAARTRPRSRRSSSSSTSSGAVTGHRLNKARKHERIDEEEWEVVDDP